MVSSVGTAFKDSNIVRFTEFVWFVGLTHLEDRAFENTRTLKAITLPNTLTHIGSNAFYWSYESALYSLTIPASVATGGRQIINRSKLQEVYFLSPTPLTTSTGQIMAGCENCPNGKIYVPIGSGQAYASHLTNPLANGWEIIECL